MSLKTLRSWLQEKINFFADRYYENLIIIGNFNLTQDNFHLETACSTLGLPNFIKEPTCLKLNCNPSSINAILANHETQFKDSKAIETGTIDCHKMI